MTGPETAPIIFDEVAELREKTERLSQSLAGRLKSHLATLYPILARKRVFGKYNGVGDGGVRAGPRNTRRRARPLVWLTISARGAQREGERHRDLSMGVFTAGEGQGPTHYFVSRTLSNLLPVRLLPRAIRRIVAVSGERRKPAIRHFVRLISREPIIARIQ